MSILKSNRPIPRLVLNVGVIVVLMAIRYRIE